MASYRLTNAADADLDRLFVFGVDTFGVEQAELYVAGLYDCLDELVAHPDRWPKVDHIRQGARRRVYGSHSIYYRIGTNEVVILRILGMEDPQKQLR